jgi:hypothetical protein
VNFQCKITTGTFRPDIFNPINEAFGPATVCQFFRYLDSVEMQDGLDLVLAVSLLLDHKNIGTIISPENDIPQQKLVTM